MMEEEQKLKEQILLKLKDIENSQVALIEKLAIVQLDLDKIQNEELVNLVVKIHSNASNNLDITKKVIEVYEKHFAK